MLETNERRHTKEPMMVTPEKANSGSKKTASPRYGPKKVSFPSILVRPQNFLRQEDDDEHQQNLQKTPSREREINREDAEKSVHKRLMRILSAPAELISRKKFYKDCKHITFVLWNLEVELG